MRSATIVAVCLCAGRITAAQAVQQTVTSVVRSRDPANTPSVWLQLRSGADNAGVVGGTLEANWHYASRLPVRAITVAGGMVFVGTESADAETNAPVGDEHGSLTALDAQSGAVVWSRMIPTWIHSDVLYYKDRVYVTCGRWPMVHEGGMLALDAHSGATLWTARAEAGMMPGAAIDTVMQTITAAGGDGVLTTMSLKDGSRVRSTGMGSADGMSSVRLDDNGIAFIGAASSLESYSPRTGAVNWTFQPQLLRALGDVPVAITPHIVLTTGSRNYGLKRAFHDLTLKQFVTLAREGVRREHLRGYRGWFKEQVLMAVDRSTGRAIWRRSLGIGLSVPRNQSGTPVVTRDRVVVSSPVSRIVWAFNLRDGTPLWHHQLNASHKGATTIAGNDVILGDKSGKMTILNLTDGAVVGTCDAGSSFSVTAPIVAGKTLVVPTHDAAWATPYETFRARIVRGGKCFGDMTVAHR